MLAHSLRAKSGSSQAQSLCGSWVSTGAALCLRPFVLQDERLVEALRHPIRYREEGRPIAEGLQGTVLRRILGVWSRALDAGVLGASQKRIAEDAKNLLDALADVAIDAIIDEATGYQRRRAHDSLQQLLAAYVLPEVPALPDEVSYFLLRANISGDGLAVRRIFFCQHFLRRQGAPSETSRLYTKLHTSEASSAAVSVTSPPWTT